ncbi:hypothetical protein [Archangium lansingense]|uniref:Lipoprotein n=1 Tax=Archangium lansingense TaxID=2995310 RepID=A0ABT4APC7_9BACT|nr:hypothetical protein [Archangium lansinium]MCY1083568.1 hypothetical protein [Archangium lansinium]
MRKFFLISSAALSMLAVGCVTPQSVCETSVQNSCAKLFECSSTEVKGSDTFKSIYGTNAAECETKLGALTKCDSKKDFDEMCTDEDAGKTFDLGKASECSDGIKSLACADFNSGKLPAACAQTCK